MRRFLALAFAVGSLLPASPLAAQSARAKVEVEIEGVSGPMRRNVRLLVDLARAADEKEELPVARIRQLHRQADRDIERALEPFGFYRPTVRKSLRQEGGRWVARYVIVPGPAVIVRTVDFRLAGEGAAAPELRQAVEDFPLHRGDTLRHLPYTTAKLDLLTLASDSGYVRAKFDSAEIRVDRQADTARIVLRFDTGPRFRFGPVAFDQTALDTGFLQTRVPFERGDPYRRDKLLELQNNLAEDPYFSAVEVVPQTDRARGREVPIEVDLVMQKPQAYELGAGYATDEGPRGRALARLRRLNRRGHHAELEVSASGLRQSLSTQYVIPAFLHPTGSLTFVGGYAMLDPETSNSDVVLVGARLSRQRIGWQETASLQFQREAFDVGADTGVANFLSLGLAYERTTSNNLIFPSRGQQLRVSAQGARDGLLSDVSFLRADVAARFIRSTGPRTRILLRADVGRIFTDQFREMPPSMRFFTGGTQTVRGYRFQSLAPRDSAGNVIGGQVLIAASIEADHRFVERWAIAAFTDVGDATEGITLRLRHSVGLGIRWLSPIGLIRVDAAYTLNQPDYITGSRLHFHLNIGPDL